MGLSAADKAQRWRFELRSVCPKALSKLRGIWKEAGQPCVTARPLESSSFQVALARVLDHRRALSGTQSYFPSLIQGLGTG